MDQLFPPGCLCRSRGSRWNTAPSLSGLFTGVWHACATTSPHPRISHQQSASASSPEVQQLGGPRPSGPWGGVSVAENLTPTGPRGTSGLVETLQLSAGGQRDGWTSVCCCCWWKQDFLDGILLTNRLFPPRPGSLSCLSMVRFFVWGGWSLTVVHTGALLYERSGCGGLSQYWGVKWV